jgi:hypothetical protein
LRDCLRKLKETRLQELRDRMLELERERNEDALLEVGREYQSLLKQVKSVGEPGGGESPPDFPRREGS